MDFVEQVKSSVDIVKSHRRIRAPEARRQLAALHWACARSTPKKRRRSPSTPSHQFYKCFGCGAGGDVFKFVMEIERISFFEALKLVAERNGIAMPKREYSDPDSKLRGALMEMHEIAARVFQSNLNGPAGAQARHYLAGRNVTPEQIAEFGLGLSDASGNQLVRQFESRFAPEQLEQSGLVLKRQDGSGYFDRFRGRLMFPIHNESGKVIGFGGRALRPGDEPKYLNSPETPLYRKSYVLYNLHRAKDAMRKSDYAVLVEGYMDVIGVYSAGVRNVVASCGTALTNTQVRALKRHSERIVVNFDPDTAGANAAETSIQMLLDESLQVRVLELERRSRSRRIRESTPAPRPTAAAGKSSGVFPLAGRSRAQEIRHAHRGGPNARIQVRRARHPAHLRPAGALRGRQRCGRLSGCGREAGARPFQQGTAERRTTSSAVPRRPPNERLLLNSLLASEAARAQAIPELRELAAVDRFVTRNVFKALFAMHSDGAAVPFCGPRRAAFRRRPGPIVGRRFCR